MEAAVSLLEAGSWRDAVQLDDLLIPFADPAVPNRLARKVFYSILNADTATKINI